MLTEINSHTNSLCMHRANGMRRTTARQRAGSTAEIRYRALTEYRREVTSSAVEVSFSENSGGPLPSSDIEVDGGDYLLSAASGHGWWSLLSM
ncbi:hypothetical protein EVAR_7925_1 [Eumeta japonica]|uniref:Uncharacterized protein n=1 Tax=Eumeta variegata TaxID=151549 RepID=A0A4C1TV73_EUMVA|nr:hypothetical protein EVAR_7925_1 [Eumeta japonica]